MYLNTIEKSKSSGTWLVLPVSQGILITLKVNLQHSHFGGPLMSQEHIQTCLVVFNCYEHLKKHAQQKQQQKFSRLKKVRKGNKKNILLKHNKYLHNNINKSL